MKTFFGFIFKVIVVFIVVFILLGIAQTAFDFRVGELLGNLLGGTELDSVSTNMSQEIVTPVFEIVSLDIFYPKNLSLIEVSKFQWWKADIGTVFIIMEYDSLVKLGVRDPQSIKMERIDNTVYVDESTIIIELLDAKLNNFHHVRTLTSNIFVMKTDLDKEILNALNLIESELIEKMTENGQANFEYAKINFKENYQHLCKAMDLKVVWI